ncbi:MULTISPECIES: ABC transporter permease [Thiorhodovibrio]|uniref:ABC transporter permease n=1 Tax=Thiorhodovibrio TaxID=61593 RepID=UPI00191218B6|nr:MULTISPECIES: ABC transporter permease [Thiorhodovibrio]MBK5969017.1 ABC transporter permease [Thiorhodovibrio winogradskyi]WPL15103.1 Teichoic acid translocation permease protein TagG [Thiorhodovibrio litoralis]
MSPLLLLNFTRQDFVDRYAGSAFGAAWAFIHPLVMIFIFTVIFANVMGARLAGEEGSTYGYPIYLVSGLLPWLAFANTVSRSSTVFFEKRNIISKIQVTLAYLPIYIVLSESVTFAISLSLFLGFLAIIGQLPNNLILLLPLIFILQQIFAFGLGLFFGVLNVFLQDIKEMVGVLFTFWFWLTPIVWVSDIAPVWVQNLQALLNPAYLFVAAYRDIFVHGVVPDFTALSQLAIIAHATLLLSWFVLKALEKDVRDFL